MYPMRPSTLETLRKLEVLIKFKKEEELKRMKAQEGREKFNSEKVRKLADRY
jgi:hypothetical protein